MGNIVCVAFYPCILSLAIALHFCPSENNAQVSCTDPSNWNFVFMLNLDLFKDFTLSDAKGQEKIHTFIDQC
jgi:hypothetical protein